MVFKRALSGLTISSVCIILGMWTERFTIIIPSASKSCLPYARRAYTPSWVEWPMTADLCAGVILTFVLFSKFFQIISAWEKEEDPGKGDEDK